MGDLLDLSARIIDSGVTDQPVNRVTNELSELADDLMSKGIFAAVARESQIVVDRAQP